MTPLRHGRRARTFEEHRDALVHEAAATVVTLGAVLVPLFFALDVVTAPVRLLRPFGCYRAAVTAACVVGRIIIQRTRPGRWSYLHPYALTVVITSMITKMTIDLGGFESRYYAGLNLVITAVGLLIPWHAIHSLVNGAIVVLVYVGANAIASGPTTGATVVSNLYFLCSLVAVAVAAAHVRDRLLRREYRSRTRLARANGSLHRSRAELRAARDALWGEMQLAQSLQTALLPPPRQDGPWEIAGRMIPAEQVGGDYYDVLETDAGERWVAIGDVSGHGVESGLVMMMAQTSVATILRQTPGMAPSGVLRAVNAAVTDNVTRLGSGRYMTLNVVRLHDDRLTLAGKHQDVLVWRRGERRVDVITNDGHWIGIVPRLEGLVVDHDVPMDEGDTALFFTDGVTEAMSAEGEMFGPERLAAAFAAVADRPAGEVLNALFSAVAAFQDRQDDDVTMLVVRRGRETASAGRAAAPTPATITPGANASP